MSVPAYGARSVQRINGILEQIDSVGAGLLPSGAVSRLNHKANITNDIQADTSLNIYSRFPNLHLDSICRATFNLCLFPCYEVVSNSIK